MLGDAAHASVDLAAAAAIYIAFELVGDCFGTVADADAASVAAVQVALLSADDVAAAEMVSSALVAISAASRIVAR